MTPVFKGTAQALRTARARGEAIADACFGEDAGDTLAADLRSFLENHGVDPQDVEANLAAPPRHPPRRRRPGPTSGTPRHWARGSSIGPA